MDAWIADGNVCYGVSYNNYDLYGYWNISRMFFNRYAIDYR
jgi:hypothetical protein